MRKLFNHIVLLCFFMITYNFSYAQVDFDKGLQAFDAKNYKQAFSTLKPYAEKGNCLAQYVIGFSYQYGLSVTTNDSLARHWLLLAAEQKQTNAMGPLAANLMSASDEQPDYIIKAYMWAVLAAEYLPSQRMASTRYVIKGYLKPEQLDAANRLIDEYKLKWKDKQNCPQ